MHDFWIQTSIGWVALSSLFVRLFVRLSRIGNTSSHLHCMMFQTIQTIYFLWGYNPGNMSVSFIAELSPVYCCLVCTLIWFGSVKDHILFPSFFAPFPYKLPASYSNYYLHIFPAFESTVICFIATGLKAVQGIQCIGFKNG